MIFGFQENSLSGRIKKKKDAICGGSVAIKSPQVCFHDEDFFFNLRFDSSKTLIIHERNIMKLLIDLSYRSWPIRN